MRNNIRLGLKNLSTMKVLQSSRYTFIVACGRKEPDMSWYNHQRLRPYNIFFNAILLGFALFWNILHLPQTWYTRKEVNKRIILTRNKIINSEREMDFFQPNQNI